MNAPLIGITAPHAGRSDGERPSLAPLYAYAEAVASSGGLPVILLPVLRESQLSSLFARLDGILFSGGGDVDPQRYGEDPSPYLRDVDAARDEAEILLARWAAEQGKPFLGICRGLQVVNVALGGSLLQHLEPAAPDALTHDDAPAAPGKVTHAVRLAVESRLAVASGADRVSANSYHHQAVDRLGAALQASAWADDGVIEAVELTQHPFGLAVQWHPERLLDRPEARAIFTALTQACSKT